ncbi:MAG: ABC transporter permease [Cardiobacteriaceae bacterium]|nr:ABC transporter permease [Cardiobacteriaceae bacterium]
MNSLKNIFTLVSKELRSLLSDPILMFLIIYMFTGLVIAMSQSNTDIRNAAIAIIDEDHSTLSHRIRDAVRPPYFHTPASIERTEADAAMDRGDYVFIVDIPPNFERNILQGHSPEVQLLIDATRMSQAGVGAGYFGQIFNQEVNAYLGRADSSSLLPLTPVLRTRYNPNSENAYQMPVTAVGNAILLLLLLLTGAAVIRERERSTIEHLLVMPVTSSEIMLAKIIANGLIILIASTLSLWFVVHQLIGVPINGSIPLYIFGSATYLFSIASLAIMIATLTPSMQQYSLLMLPLFIIMNLFSGATTSRSNMPELTRAISEYWPSTQYSIFSQALVFRGADFSILWPQLLIMAITGILFLSYALLRFRNMLEKQN